MSKFGILFGLTFSLLASANVPYEKDYLTVEQKNELKAILEESLSSQKLPSVLAAATLDDKVIWARGVGYADLENKISPKVEEHLYRWASVSKVATERFAQALEEAGKIDQDLPISKYIDIEEPSFLRRCFKDDIAHQQFITCTKNYGGFGPVVMMNGFPRCFNPSTLAPMETKKNNVSYFVSIIDQTKTEGIVVYKNNSEQTKCQAPFETKLAYVSSNKVTLNDLLSHQSGILHYDYLGMTATPPEALIANKEAVLQRKANGQSQMEWAIPYFYPKNPLLFLPGVGKHYSTFGYNLAGVVIEAAAKKTFDQILNSYAWKLGALSIQPDYLGLPPAGDYSRSRVYKREEGKFKLNQYTTDNSYKLAGGGIMSTVVALGKFCAGVGMDNMITNNGRSSYTHSGSHPERSQSLLVLKTNGSNQKQCLVLMTNTQHGSVDLDEIRSKLENKLINQKVWKPYRSLP